MKKVYTVSLVLLQVFCVTFSFSQDPLIAVKKGSTWGYVNTTGTYVIPARFEDAYPFYKGRAVAVENGQFGIIDEQGKWAWAARKGKANPELNSNRLVCSDEKGKWGALDMKGKEAVPFEYDAASAFQNGWMIAGKNSGTVDLVRIIVIDTLGKAVLSFDNIYLPLSAIHSGKKIRDGYVSVLVDGAIFSSSLKESTVKLDGRPLYFALLDVRNKRLVNLRIPSLDAEVREGRFNMTIEGISYSWSAPLPADPAISDAKFSILATAIFPFASSIAAIHQEGKWAFIDKDGSLLSETNLPIGDYKNDSPLYAGGFVIFFKKSGEGIFTDLNGNQRIAMEFDKLESFQYGAAVVQLKGKYGLIQKDGTWALPPEFEGIRF